jgi:hypothetical protein
MSEETFDREEDGFIFSDEDFGRRYFPEQKPPSVTGVSSPRQTAPTNGGGNSFMRALRRRLAAAASNRSG